MQNLKFLLPALFLFSFTFSQAQDISEDERSMSTGVNNAFIIELDAEDKLVTKLWKDYIKDYKGKSKKVKKSKEWCAEGCKLPGMNGSKPVSAYSRTESIGTRSEHIVWFDLGEGRGYLSTREHKSQAKEGDKLLKGFATYVKKEQTKMELANEEKLLKQMEKDLDKLLRQNEGFHKDIEKAEQAIITAKENIENNLLEQESTNEMITAQKEAVEAVKKRLSEIN